MPAPRNWDNRSCGNDENVVTGISTDKWSRSPIRSWRRVVGWRDLVGLRLHLILCAHSMYIDLREFRRERRRCPSRDGGAGGIDPGLYDASPRQGAISRTTHSLPLPAALFIAPVINGVGGLLNWRNNWTATPCITGWSSSLRKIERLANGNRETGGNLMSNYVFAYHGGEGAREP